MNALLLTAVLFVSFEAPEAPAKDAPATKVDASKSLDGNWTVICYEHDGKPMPEAKDCQVMVKDNVATFTCKDDKNKIKAMRFECGENGKIKAAEVDAASEDKTGDKSKMMEGVCVKTAEYVAICVKPLDAKTGAASADKEKEAKMGCTVILKRAEAKGDK